VDRRRVGTHAVGGPAEPRDVRHRPARGHATHHAQAVRHARVPRVAPLAGARDRRRARAVARRSRGQRAARGVAGRRRARRVDADAARRAPRRLVREADLPGRTLRHARVPRLPGPDGARVGEARGRPACRAPGSSCPRSRRRASSPSR
jgi:hypothetical protein